jgi:glycosyltransferase involved in cell wall biosynthesis
MPVNVLDNFMKICIVTTSYPSWLEKQNEFVRGKFVHDMAKYLVRAGVEVHVVTQHDMDTGKCESKDGVTIHRFHYFLKNHETLTRDPGIPENIKILKNRLLVPLYLFFLFWNAFKVIRENSIRIINTHWGFPTGYVGLMLKKITGSKLIITLYGAELFPMMGGHHHFIKYLLRSALKRADALAGISNATVRAAETVSGRKDIETIPDGIDIEYYVPGEKNHAILSKYHCDGKRVIFFTGRMVERKGHRFVLEAMKAVTERNMNIKLLLGGNGPLFQSLTKLRHELFLDDHVEMPGYIPEEELVPILQSVDLHVLPSCIDSDGDTEGSATAAFEAMACGTPSIVSKIGGNIGALEEGQGAYYFESGNTKELANMIEMLVSDRDLLNRNKIDARKYIEDHFSWETSVKRYLLLMDKMEKR